MYSHKKVCLSFMIKSAAQYSSVPPSIRTLTFTQHLQYKKKTLSQKWQKYTIITVTQQVSLQDSLKNFHKYLHVRIAFLGDVVSAVILCVTTEWRYQARTLAEEVPHGP